MNKDIKAKWLRALRSGRYRQTKNRLTDGKGFCCLGVLCNLHALETGSTWQQREGGPIWYGGAEGFGGSCQALPRGVRQWAGLIESNPTIPRQRDGCESLAEVNDCSDDFKRVARLIAKHL